MNKLQKIKLDKIPYIFKNVDLPKEVLISGDIHPVEGAFIAVKIMDSEGKKDVIDFSSGRLGKVIKGDIIPGVLAYRNAVVEFAGVVPKKLKQGDTVFLLLESGLLGEISGIYEYWGEPVECIVLGAIVDENGKNFNLKDYKFPKIPEQNKNIPIVALLGTQMDCGKTKMACKIINHYSKIENKKVVALKLTGGAFSQDIYKLKEAGAIQVFDFVDMGFPSTCGKDSLGIISMACNLINHAKSLNPDLIVIEFGDGIIGKYNVAEILHEKSVLEQISFFILAAGDLVCVYGAKEILKEKYNLSIDLITGPVVNSQVGSGLVSEYFGLSAESNLHEIPKTLSQIDKIFKK